jgi:hypothetical protein
MNRREEKHFAFLTSGLVCLVCAAALAQQTQEPFPSAASAQTYSVTPISQPQKVETIVGRKDKIEVIEKNGKRTKITGKDLGVLNRSKEIDRLSTPAPAPEETRKGPTEGTTPAQENAGATPAQEQNKEGGATTAPNKQVEAQPPGKREKAAQTGKSAQGNAKEAKVKAAEEEATKERAEAIRKANIEKLRKLEWDNAWFYDKSGKPISREELDKRIEKGEVADIGATDIYLQNWKTEPEKPATGNQGEGASPGTNMHEK